MWNQGIQAIRMAQPWVYLFLKGLEQSRDIQRFLGMCGGGIAMQSEIQKQKTGVRLWVGHFGLGCLVSVKGLPHITESTGCNPT